jgi:hypothetical protein
MKVKGEPSLIPQTEEDITEIKWVDKRSLSAYLNNTYANIIEVIKIFSSSQQP